MTQLALFMPESSWVPPTGPLPDLRGRLPVAVDLETRDEGLVRDMGPGWVFGWGHVAGVAVARGSHARYFPLQHPETDDLRPPEQIAEWLTTLFESDTPIVFHSANYDLGWLSTLGVPVPQVMDDVHAMAVMLDENRMSYSLDALCSWMGIPGKDETLLREAAAAHGWHKIGQAKTNMWQLPGRYVGPYAEQDAASTLQLRERFLPLLDQQDQMGAYRTEIALIPMVMEMRRRGIRIDESGADRAAEAILRQRDEALQRIRDGMGDSRIDMEWMRSPAKLEAMHDAENIQYPRTGKTKKGSFESDWMEKHPHWLPQSVARARQLDDMANKFIRGYVLGSTHRGRVHAEVHQLRDDDGGTRSHRFSYSSPPLQQIPGRDPILAPVVRGIFLPERDCLWGAHDYSQQEPRLAVHFAAVCRVPGWQDAVDYYAKNAAADFHQMVADLTGISRKQAKIINLALMYGMGLPKLAASLGVSLEEAREIMDQYNERMPFVSELADFCGRRAESRGYIRLLDGARCRWDMWEAAYLSKTERDAGWQARKPMLACDRDEADRRVSDPEHPWHRKKLRRSFTHKAMNRLVQGSAARQTKMAMLACWREGIVPLLQMHDELDFSHATEAESRRVDQIMLDVVPLRVPMKVDCQYGWNWGQAAEELDKGVEITFDEIMRSGLRTNREVLEWRAA